MKEAALQKLLRITRQFIKLRTYGHLWNALRKLHYADLASLIENLRPAEQQTVLQLFFDRGMDTGQLAEIISEIKPELAVSILAQFDTVRIAQIFEELSSDDAASLITLFPEDVQIDLLKKIKREESADIQEQLAYPEESAGRIMSGDFLALTEETSVGDAISAIQLASEDVEVPFYLYVVDDEQRLKGVVSLKQLILVNSRLQLAEIMNADVYKVDVFTDQEEVAAVVADYNLLAIPVVDEGVRLVGVVTVGDVVDIIQNEATEVIYKLAGVNQDYSTDLPVGRSLAKRIPWLLTSLLTTSVSALVVGLFQAEILQGVFLAVFMPIVAALGGVVGNQSVAIMVRELVLGNLDWKKSRKLLLKELVVILISAITIALVAGTVSAFWLGRWKFGLVFGVAIIFNLFMATLLGTLIPLGLKRLRFDPALASGMVVSMMTDALGLLSFLGLASLLLF